MNLPETALVEQLLETRFGIRIGTRWLPDSAGTVLEIAPVDLHPNEGFCIRAIFGWRTIESRFVAGRFAGDLVRVLGSSGLENRVAAAAFLTTMSEQGGRVSFRVNETHLTADRPDQWPQAQWKDALLSVTSGKLVLEEMDSPALLAEVMRWPAGILGALIALAGADHLPQAGPVGLPEGASMRVVVNRYERSRVNRAACIAAFGTSCQACRFDFGKVYGPRAEGYIHVHHVKPVSQIGAGYIIDPIGDLVPVCPNCHAFIHLREPPFLVDDVRVLLGRTDC
jgi:5-methylcytosine-specific restriction enzyme A